MKTYTLTLPLTLAAAAFASPGIAATITADQLASVDAIAGEGQPNATLGYDSDGGTGQVGIIGSTSAATRAHVNLVVGLTLPTLPAGEVIDAAFFTFRIAGGREQVSDVPGLDTYLLGTADPDNSGTSLFLESSTDPNTANAFLGKTTESDTEDLDSGNETFTPPDYTITYQLDTSALALLTSFYAGSNPTQNEAFFRFNLDDNENTDSIERWVIDVVDEDTPFLTITTIPEPASLALLAAGGLLIGARRR